MKFKLLGLIILLASVAMIAKVYPKDNKDKESLTLQVLMAVLDKMHFKPQDINDQLSAEVYKEFLDGLDRNKRFLMADEVKELDQYRDQIDDQIKGSTFEFFESANNLMENAITRSQSIYESLIDTDIALNSNELLQLDGEKINYAGNQSEMKARWKQYITYHVMTRYESYLNEQAQDSTETTETPEALKAKAVKNTKEMFDDWFERLDDIRRSDRFESYLNTVTHMFDPHTDYFSPKAKEDFDLKMGGRLEGIGARLSPQDDFTEVVSIVPGGPAWKGKKLEVEDLILKVRQEDEEEPVDVIGMRLDDVVQLIRGKKGTKVYLTIKKKSGSTEVIMIERDEVIVDESFARSTIIDLNEVKNVGYISLPVFYSTFDGGNSCAQDVAEEIQKLKANNVNGIILDLRYNGGGSLQDVIDMSGLFIEKGPIVQVKAKSGKASVYNDEDPSVLYDGPLIVMTNTISASASEILAGALQDYGRALIVGSKSTFGKGTVQGIFDLDRVYNGADDLKPLGQVKLTTQKFYRVNGGSNQLTGIIPDIILPDQFAYIDIGEKEYDHALAWSEIEPAPHSQSVYKMPDIDMLKLQSSARVKSSKIFQLIDDNARYIKEIEDDTEIPLGIDAYKQYLQEREERADKYDDIMKDPIAGFNIKNLPQDQAYIQSDSSRIARNDDWLKGLHKDVYLQETALIMKDMMQ